MKICHIGWARSIHVERILCWFAKRGHDISIMTDAPKHLEAVNVCDIRRTPDLRPRLERYKDFYFNIHSKSLESLNQIVRLRKLVADISPDIVHSHSLWYPGYLGVYVSGYPFVLTVLNGDVLWTKQDIKQNDSMFVKLRTKLAVRRADLITGESQELINACIRHGASKDKTQVIRGGVDVTRFNCRGTSGEFRDSLGLPHDRQIVLSPRNTSWFYNLDNIVKTIPRVIGKVQRVLFVFIWHGNDREKERELNTLASDLGIGEYVKVVGFVSHDEVALYHKASDIMVSVSQYDSGPVALQEALACGTVPVISDLPSVKEWITDGWNGCLVEPNDIDGIAHSIVELLVNDDKRRMFRERNVKLIQKNGDEEYWMAKLEALYYSLLPQNNNTGRSGNYSGLKGNITHSSVPGNVEKRAGRLGL